jgi:putative hydroxymethylpyrimidine transport system substrate-binding protein
VRGDLTSKALTCARARGGLAVCGALALTAVGAISACGAHPPVRPTKATLILDFTPNAVHAGIYRALAAGYYKHANIDLKVVQPTSTQETLKLIDAGKAQFGLADGSDVAGLIDKGGDAQAVMALAQRPLGGLIGLASEHLRTPADLAGKAVGITGVPSDTAVLDTELRHAGVDPKRVKVVTVGFNGGQALVAGRIAAFTGFIPDDGVALEVSGHPITAFGLDEQGGPPYPGLVAFTTRKLIGTDPALVRDFVAATVQGYEDTLKDPRRSLAELEAANPTLPRKLTAASLAVYLPLFADGNRVPFGTLQTAGIEAMSKWMVGAGLIHTPVAPARYGTNEFLP